MRLYWFAKCLFDVVHKDTAALQAKFAGNEFAITIDEERGWKHVHPAITLAHRLFAQQNRVVHSHFMGELANFRVKQTEDIVKLGDEIWVKCLGVDEKGRVRLSRRAAMAERDKEMADKKEPTTEKA